MARVVVNSEEYEEIPRHSTGQYIFDQLRSFEPERVINIDPVSGRTLTSAQLLKLTVKLSLLFQDIGLNKGDKVTIVAENTIEYCVPLVSCLYTGIIFCPLNPAYLEDELNHALTSSKARLIICSEVVLPRIKKLSKRLNFVENVIVLGRSADNQLLNDDGLDDLPDYMFNMIDSIADSRIHDFRPTDVDYIKDGALIMMSSGTTGSPKCVLINQQALRLDIGVSIHPDFFDYNPNDTTVIPIPLFHLCGLYLQVVVIAASIRTVIFDKFKPDVFLSALQNYRATKIFIPPSLVTFLANAPQVERYNLSSIQEIVVGSAPYGPEISERILNRLKSVRISQAYGTTEVGGPITMQPKHLQQAVGSIGVITPGYSAMVCDTKGRLLGAGEVGELCFKSTGCLLGYIDGDGSIQTCLDADGFYHTGDLGYYDQTGNFFIIDRIKDLIKYKGFQVSPSELENLIIGHPSVAECAVVGLPDERAGEVPVAFVVRRNDVGKDLDENEIVQYVAERISIQKRLYGGVRFVDKLPRSSVGKILKKELRNALLKDM